MLIEFITFIVTMLLLIYIMGRRAKEERKKKLDPEYVHKQQEAKKKLIREFERALDIEEEEEEVALPVHKAPPKPLPLPPPKSLSPQSSIVSHKERKKYDFKTSFAEYHPTTDIEKRHLAPTITEESIHIGDDPVVSADLTFGDREAYQIELGEPSTKIRKEIDRLPSRRKMVIYSMIFGKPKAFQQIDFREFPLIE